MECARERPTRSVGIRVKPTDWVRASGREKEKRNRVCALQAIDSREKESGTPLSFYSLSLSAAESAQSIRAKSSARFFFFGRQLARCAHVRRAAPRNPRVRAFIILYMVALRGDPIRAPRLSFAMFIHPPWVWWYGNGQHVTSGLKYRIFGGFC